MSTFTTEIDTTSISMAPGAFLLLAGNDLTTISTATLSNSFPTGTDFTWGVDAIGHFARVLRFTFTGRAALIMCELTNLFTQTVRRLAFQRGQFSRSISDYIPGVLQQQGARG